MNVRLEGNVGFGFGGGLGGNNASNKRVKKHRRSSRFK